MVPSSLGQKGVKRSQANAAGKVGRTTSTKSARKRKPLKKPKRY